MQIIKAVDRSLRLFVGGVLIILIASCAADAGRLDAAPEPDTQPSVMTGLPPVPLDLPGSHNPAAIDLTTQTGADASSISAGATIAGTALTITAAAVGLEYGIYSFAPGTAALTGIEVSYDISAGEQVWIGIANYGPRKWEFQGPFAEGGTAQLANLDAGLYLNQEGYCHVLVAAYNGTTASVATVVFTTDDAPLNFSVSGNITADPGEIALSGVTLTMEPGGAVALTDSAGDYMFDQVAEGEYTLTPTLAGYTFSPPSYNLNLQGLATDVDFYGLPE